MSGTREMLIDGMREQIDAWQKRALAAEATVEHVKELAQAMRCGPNHLAGHMLLGLLADEKRAACPPSSMHDVLTRGSFEEINARLDRNLKPNEKAYAQVVQEAVESRSAIAESLVSSPGLARPVCPEATLLPYPISRLAAEDYGLTPSGRIPFSASLMSDEAPAVLVGKLVGADGHVTGLEVQPYGYRYRLDGVVNFSSGRRPPTFSITPPTDEASCAVTVNGRHHGHIRKGERLYYAEVVALAEMSGTPSMTWRYQDGTGSGILSPGQSVEARAGMIFNVCHTGNA
jgi:hypothetical protein